MADLAQTRGWSISEGQRRFFNDFGYLRLRGWLRKDIDWITTEFETLFADTYRRWGVEVDPHNRRYILAPFIDASSSLSTLVDHPAVDAAFEGLLGGDWCYLPGEGNYLHAGTGWHVDGPHASIPFVKMAIYLDPVGRDSGCLQFIAGSHRPQWAISPTDRMQEEYGVDESDLPGTPVPTEPGDLLLFRHTTYHASSGAKPLRRMFTLNACPPPTQRQEAEFLSYLDRTVKYFTSRIRNQSPTYRMDSLYGAAIVETSSRRRLRRLALRERFDGAVVELADQYDAEPLQGWHF